MKNNYDKVNLKVRHQVCDDEVNSWCELDYLNTSFNLKHDQTDAFCKEVREFFEHLYTKYNVITPEEITQYCLSVYKNYINNDTVLAGKLKRPNKIAFVKDVRDKYELTLKETVDYVNACEPFMKFLNSYDECMKTLAFALDREMDW